MSHWLAAAGRPGWRAGAAPNLLAIEIEIGGHLWNAMVRKPQPALRQSNKVTRVIDHVGISFSPKNPSETVSDLGGSLRHHDQAILPGPACCRKARRSGPTPCSAPETAEKLAEQLRRRPIDGRPPVTS